MHFLNGKIKFIFFPAILELCWFLWEIYFFLPMFKLEFLQVNDVGHDLGTEQQQWLQEGVSFRRNISLWQ